jgi:uncharacterized membrane protein YeaQ/YmgE (transglycosylase-associated protein family)
LARRFALQRAALRVQARHRAVCRNSCCGATENGSYQIVRSAYVIRLQPLPTKQVHNACVTDSAASAHDNLWWWSAGATAISGVRLRRHAGRDSWKPLSFLSWSGWLAGQIMKGGGFGLIGDIIVGVIGAVVGGWLWGALKLPAIGPWWLTDIIIATVGACILLFILRLIKR